jgi:hypothetical protein
MKDGIFSVKISVYFNDKQKLVSTGIMLLKKDVDFLKKNHVSLSGKIKDDELRNLWNRICGEEFIDTILGDVLPSQLHKIEQIIAILGDKFSFEALQVKTR